MSKWISISEELPIDGRYVALLNRNEKYPPAIGWALFWQPKNDFYEFAVQDDYESDFGKDFAHWMDLTK